MTLRFRGSYAEGFRAPTIGELVRHRRRASTQHDRRSVLERQHGAANFNNDRDGARQLHRAGVPAGGTYQQANRQLSVITGGNENLKPETSKSWVFGGVSQPAIFPGFSIEVELLRHQGQGRDPGASTPTSTLTNCVY